MTKRIFIRFFILVFIMILLQGCTLPTTSNSLTTQPTIPIVFIETENLSQTEISFDVIIDDNQSIGFIKRIVLYQEEAIVQIASDINQRTFSNLQPNTTYQIRLTYQYQLQDETLFVYVNHDFSTSPIPAPSIRSSTLLAHSRNISYEYEISDPNEYGSMKSVQLFLGETLIQESTSPIGTFEGLLSNHQYTLVASYAYDLADGQGEQILTDTSLISTLPITMPELYIVDAQGFKKSISFDLFIVDPDQALTITSMTLYRQGEKQEDAIIGDLYHFEDLLSNQTYEIRVEYRINKNDTSEEEVRIVTETVYTSALTTPTFHFDSVIATETDILFAFNIEDPDTTIESITYDIFDGLQKVKTMNHDTNHTVTGLYSNRSYLIRATVRFNLNYGLESQVEYVDYTIKTQAKVMPSITIQDLLSSQQDCMFDVLIIDPSNAGAIKEIALYQGTEKIKVLTDLTDYLFEALYANTNYQIKVIYSYDLNEGLGNQELLETATFITKANQVPTIYIKDIQSSEHQVDVQWFWNDVDNVATFVSAKLYLGENEVRSSSQRNLTTFIDLDSDTWYKLELTYTVNLRDNTETKVVIQTAEVQTKSYSNFRIESFNVMESNVIYPTPTELDIQVKLMNPRNYSIFGMTLEYTNGITTEERFISALEITKVTDQMIQFSMPIVVSPGIYQLRIKTIEYGIQESHSILSEVRFQETIFNVLNQDSYIPIYNATNLKNMINGNQYQLQNDINLSGVAWIPFAFEGFIDGNHFAIRNLTIQANIELIQPRYIGLFTTFSGTIRNLDIVDASIQIQTQSITHAGIIAGHTQGMVSLDNVTVSGQITINQTLKKPMPYDWSLYIGGLFGTVAQGDAFLFDLHTDIDVIVENIIDYSTYEPREFHVGGYIGKVVEADVTILRSNVNGMISTDSQVLSYGKMEQLNLGGFIGFGYQTNHSINIQDCESDTFINQKSVGFVTSIRTGGFIGYGKNIHISNGVSRGITSTYYYYPSSTGYTYGHGGFIGSGYDVSLQDATNYMKIDTRLAAGGIAGRLSYATLENIVNYGLFSSSFAGSAGLVVTLSNATVRHAYNHSDIEVSHDSGGSIAGLFLTVSNSSLEYIANTGKMTVDAKNSSESASAVGLIGGTSGTTSIRFAYNTGDVTARSAFVYPNNDWVSANYSNVFAAGLIGGSSYSLEIRDSYNLGNVTAIYNEYKPLSMVYAGGIIAENSGNVMMSQVFNAGEVRATAMSSKTFSGSVYVGGLVGYNVNFFDRAPRADLNISDSYNAGDVYVRLYTLQSTNMLYSVSSFVGKTTSPMVTNIANVRSSGLVYQNNSLTQQQQKSIVMSGNDLRQIMKFSPYIWNLDDVNFINKTYPTLRLDETVQ